MGDTIWGTKPLKVNVGEIRTEFYCVSTVVLSTGLDGASRMKNCEVLFLQWRMRHTLVASNSVLHKMSTK